MVLVKSNTDVAAGELMSMPTWANNSKEKISNADIHTSNFFMVIAYFNTNENFFCKKKKMKNPQKNPPPSEVGFWVL